MSPRRNARALARRPKRHAASGKTRALGQHFLRDDRVAERIIGEVRPTIRDLVIEIGPGLGALTGRLARAAGRLLALEVDEVMASALLERFADAPHVEVFVADARSFNYAGLSALKPDPAGRVLVVGNLPYSVGKPILQALVEAGPVVDEMALMLQKEVAERVAALPGGKTYGSLSVLTQLYCDVRVALRVPPGAFRPPPKVESAVLHVRVLSQPRVALADERRFHAVVRAAFGQRRKTLANALAAGLGLPIEVVKRKTTIAGVDPGRRAETLTILEFAEVARQLS